MKSVLEQALDYVFGNEGGTYTNDPRDSGGPTKWGVTQKAYAAFIGHWPEPWEIENLSLDTVKIFYQMRYWQPLAGDRILDPAVAITLFDAAVLYGVGTAVILAQKVAAGKVQALKFDGLMGDKSLDAINSMKREDFIPAFHGLLVERINTVLSHDPKNEVFRKGWTARADRLLTLTTLAPFNREAPVT